MIVVRFLFLIILFSSCDSTKSTLEGSWIIVKTEQAGGNAWIPDLTGTLINFDQGIMKMSSVGVENVVQHIYRIEKEVILTDSFQLEIIGLTENGLSLIADRNSFVIHLKPLVPYKFEENAYRKLSTEMTSSLWNLQLPDYSFRFYFDTTRLNAKPNSGSNLRNYVLEESSSGYENLSKFEWWSLRKFEDCVILSYSVGQRNSDHIQLLSNNKEGYKCLIYTESDSNIVPTQFTRENTLSDLEIMAQKEDIIGKWATNEVIEPDLTELFSIEDSSQSIGMSTTAFESRFTVKDLLNKEVAFEFLNDGSYNFASSRETIRKGEFWDITEDGKYIVLDSKRSGENFIRLLNLSEDAMMVRKNEEISTTQNDDINYSDILLSLNMKKVN